MLLTAKKSLFDALKTGLVLAALVCVPLAAYAGESMRERNAAYVSEVVSVLRAHVHAMRMILDHDGLRYSDNMVRHAEAFERTFGMVGPMEWHVAEAFTIAQKKKNGNKLTEEQFEQLAEDTRIAIKKIKRSAIRYGRDKKKDLMRASINRMIKSCGACHSKLPEGTVPRVWKGMKE